MKNSWKIIFSWLLRKKARNVRKIQFSKTIFPIFTLYFWAGFDFTQKKIKFSKKIMIEKLAKYPSVHLELHTYVWIRFHEMFFVRAHESKIKFPYKESNFGKRQTPVAVLNIYMAILFI